jgi:hypothetical protein
VAVDRASVDSLGPSSRLWRDEDRPARLVVLEDGDPDPMDPDRARESA